MSLPAIATPSLLSSIRSNIRLPAQTWYLIAASTFSTLNRADEVPRVFQHTIQNGSSGSGSEVSETDQLHIARRMREALVKSSAIIGLPKTINSLFALKRSMPKHLHDEPLGYSPTARVIDIYTTPPSQILQRGQRFFDRVYGKVTKQVMGQMDRSGTEDLGLLARLEYGYVLSPTNVLNAAETSHVVLACLIPQDVNPQLKGHLVGALNNGATEDEVRAVRDVVVEICEAAGMKRLDDTTLNGWGWRQDVANLKPQSKL